MTTQSLKDLYVSEMSKLVNKINATHHNKTNIAIELYDYIIKNNIFSEIKHISLLSNMLMKLDEAKREDEVFKQIKVEFLKIVPQDMLDQVPEDIYQKPKPMSFPTLDMMKKEKISKYFYINRRNNDHQSLIPKLNEVVYNEQKRFFELKDKTKDYVKFENKNNIVCMVENGNIYLPFSYWEKDDDDKELISTELSLMFSSQNITSEDNVTIRTDIKIDDRRPIDKNINCLNQIKLTNKQDFDNVYNNTDICKDVCRMIFGYCGFYVTICSSK